MREWHKPTVEETESGMEVTSYLPAEWIALNPSLLILGNRNGGPAGAGSPFPFGGLRATLWLRLRLPKLPVQIFLMWCPDRFHRRVMCLSSRPAMLDLGWGATMKDEAAAPIYDLSLR